MGPAVFCPQVSREVYRRHDWTGGHRAVSKSCWYLRSFAKIGNDGIHSIANFMTRMQQAQARKGPGPWFLRFRAMGSWLRVLAVIVTGVFGGASGTAWAGFSLLESNDTIVDTLPLIRVDGEEIEGSVRVRDFGEVTLIPRLEGGSHYYTMDGSEPSS